MRFSIAIANNITFLFSVLTSFTGYGILKLKMHMLSFSTRIVKEMVIKFEKSENRKKDAITKNLYAHYGLLLKSME